MVRASKSLQLHLHRRWHHHHSSLSSLFVHVMNFFFLKKKADSALGVCIHKTREKKREIARVGRVRSFLSFFFKRLSSLVPMVFGLVAAVYYYRYGTCFCSALSHSLSHSLNSRSRYVWVRAMYGLGIERIHLGYRGICGLSG